MKFTYPVVRFTAGSSAQSEFSFSNIDLGTERLLLLSFGRPYVAAFVGTHTFDKDFRVADRARALVGIFALAFAFAFACLVPVPLYLLGLLLGRLSTVAEFIADKIVKPFVDFTIPVPVYGIRNTFKTLFRVVTK
ncbi:hypothetical protein [Caulobacter segnis]|uniref:Uncharacterized protein n=1 Tax=Caulobacter segnis TaxID=88688 RepID=A0A2W5VL51_9CAUL|nr:hypothetical protein [Caulobacter segnis]PZR36065.1 MAG: hypothetical protein DI526_04665 [Caulobacter segnis]